MDPVSFFVVYKPFVTILHVLSVVVGMGGALMADMLFAYFAYNKKLAHSEVSVVRKLSFVVTLGLCAIVITGIGLFLSNPAGYMASTKFLVKMSVVTILAINGLLLHRYVFSYIGNPKILSAYHDRGWRKVAAAMGAVSFVSWGSAMSLGVLDKITWGYTETFALYVGAVIVGIGASQAVVSVYERQLATRTKSLV